MLAIGGLNIKAYCGFIFMKKITTLLGLLSFAGAAFAQNGNFPLDTLTNPSLSNLKVAASVGFESEYVFRGVKYAGYSVQPKVELAYPVAGFDVYAGAWMNAPVQSNKNSAGDLQNLQEIDFYTGAAYSYEMITVDMGYTYYWYTAETDGKNRENEVYAGFTFDTASFLEGVNVNPSIYYFYNFQTQQHVVETSVGYEFTAGSYLGVDGLTMPLRAYCGWLSSDRFNGDQTMGPDLNASYMYYGASADVAYAFNEYCTISAGVRFSQHFNRHGEARELQGSEKRLWYGVKVDFGF